MCVCHRIWFVVIEEKKRPRKVWGTRTNRTFRRWHRQESSFFSCHPQYLKGRNGAARSAGAASGCLRYSLRPVPSLFGKTLGTLTCITLNLENINPSVARTTRGNKGMANSTGGRLFLMLLLFVPQTAITIDVATIGLVGDSNGSFGTNRATCIGGCC